jgi:hypothetical protein
LRDDALGHGLFFDVLGHGLVVGHGRLGNGKSFGKNLGNSRESVTESDRLMRAGGL